jgi:nucleotide-binding universal stress UspA family protein
VELPRSDPLTDRCADRRALGLRSPRSREFDTIVVGHRHLPAVERLVEPSVATHVATHSDSTVVIVH